MLGQIACHRQRHAGEPGLGCAVGLLSHLAVEGGDRRGEHHHAALAVFQRRQLRALGGEQPADVVSADQVDVDYPHEVLERRSRSVLLHHPLGGADAGDIHQDACRAMGAGSLGQSRGHAFGNGDVALAGDAPDFRGDLFGLRLIHIEYGDLRAQPREFACRGFAQARGSAGYEGGLSIDFHVWFPCGWMVKGRVPPCSASTRCWRCLSTAAWLIDPLSVTSPLSIDGGSCIRCSRATRLALPVATAARVSMTFWKCACTGLLSRTCLSGASSGKPASLRTAGVGKIRAPTSCRLMPVMSASCT